MRGVPVLHLAHGLLRAPPWRKGNRPLLSLTARNVEGSHSGADILSADRVLASRGWETPALLNRAAAARRELVAARLGGDWWNSAELPGAAGRTFVLFEDAPPSTPALAAMLNAALTRNSPAEIVVVAPGQTPPWPTLETIRAQGGAVVSAAVDLWRVAREARRVYTIGGEVGFLALLAGCEVYCFGTAFYSGWGVTIDDAFVPQKPFPRSVEEIFAGACLLATRYRDPFRDTVTGFEDVAAILADWRRIEAVNRSIAACAGISFWKRRRIAEFLRTADGPPASCPTPQKALAAAAARPGSAVAVWASREPEGFRQTAARRGIPLIRIEDGFIRSVGLGSDFMLPASLALDRGGMYYDPRGCSDLERLLRDSEFPLPLLDRARGLILRLVEYRVTKYNLASAKLSLEYPPSRHRILVPGQVEDDLSVRFGGAEVRDNRDLLARVRSANPDAFILYKPHPDVEAGHRRGALRDAVAKEFADAIVRGVSAAVLLAQIDELHTLTSLTGFEALLRRRRVVVYGRPFYAGWGLTTDLAPIDRGRRLTLEELVAGALILYPRYLDPVTRLPCPPEIVIERLGDPGLWRPGPLVIARRLQGELVRRWNAFRP